MPRTSRSISVSGYYHVMIRGNGHQIIFEDDHDRLAFLEMLAHRAEENGISIIAWCLMDTHVHLVIEDQRRRLSEFMASLTTQFARRFNDKTGHVGHVFQGRFKSVPIETDGQLLETIRYVHNNPEKAGICPASEYAWSSYREYVSENGPDLASTDMVLSMLDGPDHFAEFCAAPAEEPLPNLSGKRIPEEELLDVAQTALHGRNPAELKSLSVAERNDGLRALRRSGLSCRQIERLTGIGRKTISKVTS